jgi:hypothetical protein
MTAADGLIEAAEATRNPWALSFVLAAYATAFGDAYPDRALDAFRRGLVVAQESGNRFIEFQLAALNLSRLEVAQGDLLSAFDHFSLAIRNMHDSGNTTTIRSPLALLATVLDRLGRLRVGGHNRRVREQSPHRDGIPRDDHGDRPPSRCPRRPDLRIARPRGRDDEHLCHGHLRIRPNRPGPSRTRRRLEIDDIQESQKSVALLPAQPISVVPQPSWKPSP